MPIPADFTFSQNNLQDFVDCPRRFELRYLLRQMWPAIRSEPVLEHEKTMLRGEQFHQMVHQHQLNLPIEQISDQTEDPILLQWWQDYLANFPAGLPERRFFEHTLQTSFGGYRLIGKYDLLAIEPGKRAVIVDWKTGARKTNRPVLKQRIQTRLYPLLLVEAGASLNDGQPLLPGQVEFVYWFSAEPGQPENFIYSREQYQTDRDFLLELIAQVEHHHQTLFPLTADERKCSFCNYRSLCQRGIQAGSSDTEEDEIPEESGRLDIDFGQIGEIQF